MWPNRARFPSISPIPPGVTITRVFAVEVETFLASDKSPRKGKSAKPATPIAYAQRTIFELSGLSPYHVSMMDPGFAKMFADLGLVPESKSIEQARAAFRQRHKDHGQRVLDNIDDALKRITRNNPDLLIAYYNYYSDHELTDDIDEASGALGSTVSGDTDINKGALNLRPRAETSDPVSLLGSTLIHEYSHTPQGGRTHGVARAPLEAKAYAIEQFLADRVGDEKRSEFISSRSRNDSLDLATGSDKIFNATYNIISELYKIIDKGGSEAQKARALSVEFISKAPQDFGPDLKAFILRVEPDIGKRLL